MGRPSPIVSGAAAAAAVLLGLACTAARAALDPGRALATSRAAIGGSPAARGFTDTDGRHVTLADFRGKPLVVSFVYTGCSQVCPTTTRFLGQAVAQARAILGPDTFRVASIGFNIPADNPLSMKVFARGNRIDDPRWSFLTPDAGVPQALARDFGFSYAAQSGGYDHLTQVTILDGEGRIRAQIPGESFALPMLVGPLRELTLGEPVTQPGPGAWLDRVRLVCTVYDPASGRYRIDYSLFIEIGAGLSVLGLTLAFLLHERRRARSADRSK